MSSRSLRSHPLRLLLYLEWSLLAIAFLGEVFRASLFRIPNVPALNLTCIAAFAALGLSLPDDKLSNKILYTISEFLLTIVAVRIGLLRLFPVLYIAIAIRSCFIFERRGRTLVTALVYLACLANLFERLQYRPVVRQFGLLASERLLLLSIMTALFLGLMLVFLQLFVEAILAERQSRDRLAIAHARLREYALRVEDVATLQERNRIAREIHDSLGHSLTAFNLHLEAALRLLDRDPQEAKELLVEAKQLGATALHEVRQSVSALRSDPLQGKSLEEAIAALREDFQRSTGIVPEVAISLEQDVPDSCKTAAFRIVQEALTNICKYAQATAVSIKLATRAQVLQIAVSDNGRGFQPEQTTTGFGLQGMQERARSLRGQCQIKTAPGKGCTIRVKLPLANRSVATTHRQAKHDQD